jgi:hypothetical protein
MFYCDIFGTLWYLMFGNPCYIITYFDLKCSEVSVAISDMFLVYVIYAPEYFIYFVK